MATFAEIIAKAQGIEPASASGDKPPVYGFFTETAKGKWMPFFNLVDPETGRTVSVNGRVLELLFEQGLEKAARAELKRIKAGGDDVEWRTQQEKAARKVKYGR